MSRRFADILFTTAQTHEIIDNATAVFATDLVYSLACEFEIGWSPLVLHNYVISDLSPLNSAMKRAALNFVRLMKVDYDAKYYEIVNPNADAHINPEEKLEQFIDYAIPVLSTVVDVDRDVTYIFLYIVYVARLSLVFYQRGTFDAPVIAAMLISYAIVQLNLKMDGNLYNILSDFAAKVTEDQA